MQIINPATEELIREITEDNRETLSKKFQLLRKAQTGWSGLGIKQRAKILQDFSSGLEKTDRIICSHFNN